MAVVIDGKCGPSVRALGEEIARCRVCAHSVPPLPQEPNPVAVLSSRARICICSQAPGTLADASGKPFYDPSGVRLRRWMGINEAVFYDPSKVCIVPMGFCFPGQDAKGGDLPPRRECRQTWHDRVFDCLGQFELILVIGQYARAYHLDVPKGENLTQTVAKWRDHMQPGDGGAIRLPLPHPSWRNNGWLKKNPWFDADVVPALQREVAARI
ncbi:uracil-DNA glycosylase family protein [Tepidamorphus sp. 3E244]|uniref:uracil-DNA glycosylase family protein n=1 Tax=Tepidamorphus sp. 3E244 TaxID=3385498 RepID=UPI0038FCED5F